ncbi:MAG TPA: TonB-dependent receptor plug domain-containing protein [Ferruginibacter sp.]|nr:TonB-dependent receptor plug domain-containing protein [Ferruginibacter sp.]HMP22037.1 TonB-dependent receptor plug domain-containing protein [Ferruginibacter sp.]
MKKIVPGILLCTIVHTADAQQPAKKFNDTAYLQPVEILAVRAADNAPFAKTNLTRADIEKNNLGADLPILLNQTPSIVVSSDAGNGIGYTGMRIRGSDITRINVTLNGIPYNDAESQGSFFVDLPDFTSSVNSIQIQRGVGTSTNGAGAFGASINLSTNEVNKDFYAELNNSTGSFNTWKNTLRFGSGIIGKHFTIDGRLSRISSDGYIDRASSDLKSYYASAAYIDEKNSLRFNVFSGKEITYQAWNGVPEALLKTNRTFNSAGTEKPGSPYENETDNYLQTHYQLFYNRQFSTHWKTNVAFFLTRGKGYYEQYKAAADLGDYGLPPFNDHGNIIEATDLIRRLWLDNYFYGSTYSVQHQKGRTQFTAGGGWNKYDGKHYGDVIWAQAQQAVPVNHRWYSNDAYKTDFNLFAKWTEQWGSRWQSYADVQLRTVQYDINGFRNNPGLIVNNTFTFFNPKVGISYNAKTWRAYWSYAIANKEPNRDDFENTPNGRPKHETLYDMELGFEKKMTNASFAINGYYMHYNNQLVLAGNINDVGAYTRINVPKSYRLGIELQGAASITEYLSLGGNISLSENRIKNFTELIDDYDNGGTKSNFYTSTNISFSPSVVGSASINITPVKNGEISLVGKYVGRQYLDNTTQTSRSLNPYYVQDIRLSYQVANKFSKNTSIIIQLSNVLNKKYEASGYTFSYIYDGLVTENYYFPMATFNWMVGLNIRL